MTKILVGRKYRIEGTDVMVTVVKVTFDSIIRVEQATVKSEAGAIRKVPTHWLLGPVEERHETEK